MDLTKAGAMGGRARGRHGDAMYGVVEIIELRRENKD